MNFMIGAIVLLVLFGLLGNVVCPNPCANFHTYKSREEALSCLRTIAFNEELFNEILDSYVDGGEGSMHFTQFQVFKDISKYSGSPWYVNVDLDVEFQKLKDQSSSFTNWYDAISSIWYVWASLKDIHTGYYYPYAIEKFVFMHPIAIFPTYDSSTNSLTYNFVENNMTKSSYDSYNTVFGTSHDFSAYHGWVINKMNGKTANDYMIDYSRTRVFFNRDPGANFNEVVKQTYVFPNYNFFIRHLNYAPHPESSITYELQNPDNLTETVILEDIDFISCLHNGTHCEPFDNLTELVFPSSRRNIELSSNLNLNTNPFSPISEKENEQIQDYLQSQAQSKQEKRRSGEEDETFDIICVDQYANQFAFLQRIDDPTIGIVQIVGEGNYADNGNQYAGEFVRCVQVMKAEGIKKIIIDLRLNTGGMPRLSFLMAAALTKTTFPGAGFIQTPIISTKSTYNEYFVNGQFGFFPQASKDVLLLDSYSDHPDHKLVMPDSTEETYGPLYKMELAGLYEWDDVKTQTGFEGFEPEDIIVLASGASISAGGQLLRFLQLTKIAKIATLGGFPEFVLDGGCVHAGLTTTAIISLPYNVVKLTWGSVFPQVSVSEEDNIYSVYDKLEIDYSELYEVTKSYKPDFRYFNFEDLGVAEMGDDLFNAIKADFDTCTDWTVRVNDSCEVIVENGVFGNPCAPDGEFLEDVCVLKRCDDGYFMNADKTECISIDDAPLLTNWENQFKKDNGGGDIIPDDDSASFFSFLVSFVFVLLVL